MNVTREMNIRKERIERILRDCLKDHSTDYHTQLHEAMTYSLHAGGKRLRPMLLLETAELFTADTRAVEPFACALEMIHTYSLIHDDLPAMDDDDLRRGMPTSHKRFGEDMAILAGDALLNGAYELMLEACMAMQEPHVGLRAAKIIADAAGRNGMIVGQVADIKNEDTPMDKQTLDFINANKTGALIRAAVTAGAVLGGATQAQIQQLERFSVDLGVSFQIVDDILDIEGDTQTLGKPVGSDGKNSKTTYPTLLGLEASRQMVIDLSEECYQALDQVGADVTFLKALTTYLIDRKK